MTYNNFPQQLREQKQWVMWKLENKGDKKTKVPYRNTAQLASSTDSTTWLTFEESLKFLETEQFNGIGYVFNGGVVGIDLDHCFEGLVLKTWAQEIVNLFPSYIEVSPSGNGLHIFILCDADFKGAKAYIGGGDIERYCKGRYFTVTGNIYGDYNTIKSYEPEYFLNWHQSLIKEEPKVELPLEPTKARLPEDKRILEVMFSSRNGEKLKDLYEGNWEKHFKKEEEKSQSEADLSFIGALMFFCCNDTVAVDRIFRSSGLMREKWNRRDIRDGLFEKAYSLETMKWELPEEKEERKIFHINEVLDMNEKEQPFLLKGMIVEGSVNALTADSGKGKSLVALKMVESIAKGDKFLGEFETKKAKTLIVDLEMSENDIVQRTKSIIHDKMDGLDLYFCQTFNIDNEDDYRWLTDSIVKNEYKFIVFDTLSAIHERDENSNSEMNLVNKKLIELCNKYGQTVLFLHHHKKPKVGEVQNQASSRGAGAIIDKAASQLLIDSKKALVAVGGDGEQKIGLPGLIISVEQMKRRQATGCEKFTINTCYNPQTKRSTYEFGGYVERVENAVEKVIMTLLDKMEKGEEYLMSELTEMVGKSSVLYTALKQLIEVDKKIGIRLPNDGETKNGAKIRHNSKIYYLE